MKPNHHEIGVGATDELSLRVSVGTLVSVWFASPADGRTMLALERFATLRQVEGQSDVIVKAKPFGGAVRITNPQELMRMIGHFHYDSERSREESDFRIQIRPASWERIKEICLQHLQKTDKGVLDSSPHRELTEEFGDTLHIGITSDQYRLQPCGMVIEDLPTETENVRAEKIPTVRVYFLFEAWMQTPEIILMMLANTKQYLDEDLEKLAWKDARQGGKGRANAILVVELDDLKKQDGSIPMENLNGPIRVDGHELDGNVLALLEEVENPKYQRHPNMPTSG